jgi:ParB family chromosome partitioning protein
MKIISLMQRIVVVLMFLFGSVSLFAQQVLVRGIVKDASGEQILAQGLSVRNVEEMVRNIAEGIQPELPEKKKSDRKPILPEEFKLLKDHLSRYFNTKVQLTCNEKGKGKITIPFATEEELEQLIGLLDKLK